MTRDFVIDRPLPLPERVYLRRLADRDGGFLLIGNRREKLLACFLVQAGYAAVHPIFPDKYAISPRGRAYLQRLVRAH